MEEPNRKALWNGSAEMSDAEGMPRVHTLPWRDHVAGVEEACRALRVRRGRGRDLAKLLTELFRDNKRSRDHLLAANESFEITEIYELWQPHLPRFPGLREKIADCLSKGPVVAEDERPSTASNRPRNDAFVYVLAGRLLEAGIHVLAVDGISREGVCCGGTSDIVLNWKGQQIVIECKRPQAIHGVERRIREAVGQIQDAEVPGIVALDCSRIVRPIDPAGATLGTPSAHRGLRYVEDRLQELLGIIPRPSPDKGVLGLVLFARVPHMTEVHRSTILSPTGEPFVSFQPDSIAAQVIWHDDRVRGTWVVREIWVHIGEHMRSQERRRGGHHVPPEAPSAEWLCEV